MADAACQGGGRDTPQLGVTRREVEREREHLLEGAARELHGRAHSGPPSEGLDEHQAGVIRRGCDVVE